MPRFFIKPKEGYRVKDPVTKTPLPVDGKEVSINSYWLRRIKSGDVIKVDKPANTLETDKIVNDEIEERADSWL